MKATQGNAGNAAAGAAARRARGGVIAADGGRVVRSAQVRADGAAKKAIE